MADGDGGKPPAERERKAYKTTLKKTYGLTDSMIAHLCAADKEVPNPHRRGQSSSLYRVKRVERFIESIGDAYHEHLERRALRQARASEASRERMERLVTWAEKVKIEVDPLPEQATLCAHAERHFEQRSIERGDFHDLEVSVGGVLVFVRHNMTNYEELLDEVEGKPGATSAYLEIKDRVNQRILDEMERIAQARRSIGADLELVDGGSGQTLRMAEYLERRGVSASGGVELEGSGRRAIETPSVESG